MHPINPMNFGVHGVRVSMNNGTSVVPGYIVQQMGLKRYKVSDGTTTVHARLAVNGTEAGNPPTGVFTIPVQPWNGQSGAVFVGHYAVDSATVVGGSAGTGYAINDTITMPNGTILKVLTLGASNAVATVSVQTSGDYTSLSGATNVTSTSSSGSGTGAHFALTFKLASVAITTAGTGYQVGMLLAFTSLVGATTPTAHVSAVSSGGAATVVVDTAGAGITTAASSIAVNVSADYAYKITDKRVQCVSGTDYSWVLGSPTQTDAGITVFS